MLISKTIGTVTQKGQVTIPLSVREHLSLSPNDKVAFEVRGEEVILKKPVRLSLDEVFGAVTPHNKPEDFKSLRDSAMEEHIKKSKIFKP